MSRWPLNNSYFWERLPFFRILLPLIIGIGSYSYLHFPIWITTTIFSLSAISFSLLAFSKRSNQRPGFIIFSVALFTLGYLLCYTQDIKNDRQWFGHSLYSASGYQVKLTSSPTEKNRTIKLEVDVTGAIIGDSIYSTIGKALVYIYKYNAPAYKEGDILIIPNEWQSIKNSGNPFAFDYAAYSARNNIYYQSFLSTDKVHIEHYANPSELSLIRRVHQYSLDQLNKYIYDEETHALLEALLMGDKANLSPELRQQYADTGIVHIIAISGAHIAIFFLLIVILLAWVKHKKYHWVKYMAALPLIWLYVLVAGAPPSAVRAATMFSILGIGFTLQKHPNGINQLLAAAFILLCANPFWLYDVGFQLSFIAVLSILLFYRPIYKLFSPSNKITGMLWGAISVSIAAEILIAPLVIYYFHLFPFQFIIANVLAYLFIGVVLIAGMLLLLFSFSSALAGSIAVIIMQLADWFNSLIRVLQELNPDSFKRLTLTTPELLLVYIAIASIATYYFRRKKTALYIFSAALSLFLLSSIYGEYKTLNQKGLVVYNINNGNYIELIEGKKYTVISTPEKLPDNTEEYTLAPAHIGWHTTEDSSKRYSNYFSIGGNHILILDNPDMDSALHVDYLIVNYKAKEEDLTHLWKTYTPNQIVIGNNIQGRHANRILEFAEANDINIHYTKRDAAFVLKSD